MTDANTIQTLDTRLGELLAAIESHPMMTSSQPHPTGFYVHDFIRNTHTKLRSIDAQKLQAADPATVKEFQDIRGRNMLAEQLIEGSGPMAQMMLMMGGGPLDFGDAIKQKVREVNAV
ncbi:hypothetical protein AFCA_009970 [Aspergillus flavus]|uniref:Uncharacterized protein n=1 Tax=Aspergillus flavus TaxID=5059 RepID=A0AB74C9N2_ASPFL|nr:hypothetical protein G4B11_009332 [Aspergillus flavus]RAQ52140.1 hypothetical protein AFGD_006589 [Aspergillus flavus]RMZ42182.1 hypothetical protein CA14_002749 [Aspergillus flavus]UDD62658.1 hypothetical protein AFCA_009970 [Aspergillus flavus]